MLHGGRIWSNDVDDVLWFMSFTSFDNPSETFEGMLQERHHSKYENVSIITC